MTAKASFKYEKDQPLARYESEGQIAGVCSGLARKFGGDPNYYRIGFVILTLTTEGHWILVYLALAILLPVRN